MKAGWTIFDNLYVLNGTLYLVTSFPELLPSISSMISSGEPMTDDPEDVINRLPSDKDLRIISPDDALLLFRGAISHVDGVSVSSVHPDKSVR